MQLTCIRLGKLHYHALLNVTGLVAAEQMTTFLLCCGHTLAHLMTDPMAGSQITIDTEQANPVSCLYAQQANGYWTAPKEAMLVRQSVACTTTALSSEHATKHLATQTSPGKQ